MSLLYRQGNYGSICFPYKKSCEFATKKCKANCTEQHVDMTWFTETFKSFNKLNSIELYGQIKREMDKNGFKLIFWFECGDCPSTLTEKIALIIKQLNKDGFTQIGFTRNKKFWKLIKGTTNSRFMLSVEKGSKIIDKGYYSVPDYKNFRVAIVHHHTFKRPVQESIDKIVASGRAKLRFCGGGYTYIERETVTEPQFKVDCSTSRANADVITFRGDVYEANCFYCFKEKHGCFGSDEDRDEYDE